MSTIRMTGLISGLDTDSIIKELVSAQKLKNKKTSDKLTLSEWKEDKWKELNAKLYKLYTDDLSKMRLQASYMTKKVTTSNDNLVSVTGTSNAPDGAQSLVIKNLASSQYVTSGVIKADGANAKATTKLTKLGVAEGTLLSFTTGGVTKTLEVTANTTIADYVNTAKAAGLNANYDEKQGRLFISSKESGLKNSFQISSNTSTATSYKNSILDAVGYSSLSSEDKTKVDSAIAVLSSDTSVDADIEVATQTLEKFAQDKVKNGITAGVDTEIRNEVAPGAQAEEEDNIRNEVMLQQIALLQEEARQGGASEEDIANITPENLDDEQKAHIQQIQDSTVASSTKRINAAVDAKVAEAIQDEKAKAPDDRYTMALETSANQEAIANAADNIQSLAGNYRTESQKPLNDASDMLNCLKLDSANSTTIAADDSKIIYNGVEITGSTNAISVNGLTFNLKGTTPTDETINITVSNDTQATYDMVKNFINSYNDILKEMNNLYYADSASGYAPLSDDEKEAMTDDQIEKWETKIKDSILRRDSTLGSVIDSVKGAMMSSVTVDGKKYSLVNFGITTSTDYTEKGLLHIYGNKDDSTYPDKDDKLMKALTDDPDTAIQALSGIFKNLYDTMTDKMSSIPNVRSIYNFYNDKLMDNEQNDYKKQVANLEDKLTAMEDKYYKQFSAMETALSKLQSQSNALAGLLGTPNQ